MDNDEFRVRAKQMVDYVADYLKTIEDRPPLAQVQPGYLRDLIPVEAPQQPEQWKDVFDDIERVIMPGVTHWHSPHFHAYFPTGNSYPAIIADILSAAIGCIGFSWVASPACTELEVITTDWLAKLLRLPDQFLSTGSGGGVIQNSAAEATFIAMLAAKSRTLRRYKQQNPDLDETTIISKLICYGSDEAHCSVERASLLDGVKCHKIASDDKESMRGAALQAAIQADRARGLIPFFCVATLGTTPTCAFDNLLELGPVCKAEQTWLHIDAAYAGSAFICPEFRPLLDGVEFADSFNFNPHKWLLVNYDCSAMWFRERHDIVETFNVDSLFLKVVQEHSMPDFRHWGITFGRRFRSLKLWFVLRLFGVSGLQAHIRKHVELAKEFEKLVISNHLFQLTHSVTLGIVCFRLKGENELNRELRDRINSDGRIHLVSAESKGIVFLRFVVCAATTESKDVLYAWNVIEELAASVLETKNHINGGLEEN